MMRNQFGQLVGPGPGGAPVLTLDNFQYTDPQTGKQVILKDALGYRLYDTYRFQAGNAVNQNILKFFQIPVGQQQAGGNFTTQYLKTLIDTNIESSGQVSKGRLFRVASIQMRVGMTGATDTAYGSSGTATQMPTNPAGAATISATNEEKALTEACYITFKIDGREFEQGKGVHFPSPYGYSGFAGGGIPGTANTDVLAIVNNGFGRPYRLPLVRNIDGLRQFSVEFQFGYIFTPNRNFQIEICLEGLLYRSVL